MDDPRNRPPADRPLLVEIGAKLIAYLRGQGIIVLVMTLLYALGFWLIELPWWPLAAVICGALNLAPMVGWVLGAIVPVGFMLAGGGGLKQVLLVLGVFVLVQAIESFLLSPLILGKELSLSPLLVFLSMIAGGVLFGFIGMLLAPPLVAIGLLIYRTTQRPRSRNTPPPHP